MQTVKSRPHNIDENWNIAIVGTIQLFKGWEDLKLEGSEGQIWIQGIVSIISVILHLLFCFRNGYMTSSQYR